MGILLDSRRLRVEVSMVLTSPWYPAHWVRDRLGEYLLPLCVVLDVVEGAKKIWRVAEERSLSAIRLTPY